MEFKDYYQVMGVGRDATEAQIKQAYRRLARKFHPDVSKEKDAEARFKELGEAYEVLKNPDKRAAYDQLGRGPAPGENFRPPPGWDSGFEFSGAGGADYSEFFESLFGAAAKGRRHGGTATSDSQDHHARVMLDLEAALNGGSRTFTLKMPQLDAEGRLIEHDRVLSVKIPKGVLSGQTIRLAGQGSTGGVGTKAGDLYLEIDFVAHPIYRVDGRDLYVELPVAPWEAALGASVKTPTPAGTVDLKVPAESHAGTKLRLKGRGIPATPPGDLYVVLTIALPPAADEAAKAAYRTFADALPFSPRASLGV